jgi:hypothetical protein
MKTSPHKKSQIRLARKPTGSDGQDTTTIPTRASSAAEKEKAAPSGFLSPVPAEAADVARHKKCQIRLTRRPTGSDTGAL